MNKGAFSTYTYSISSIAEFMETSHVNKIYGQELRQQIAMVIRRIDCESVFSMRTRQYDKFANVHHI